MLFCSPFAHLIALHRASGELPKRHRTLPYIREYAHAQGQAAHRFDVISVYIESNHDSVDSTDITLFRNAFSMS